MSPTEAKMMRRRVSASQKAFKADSAAAARQQYDRTSSGLQLHGAKNPKILIADPYVLERVGSAVRCMIRAEKAIVLGCENGDLVVLNGFGEEASVRVAGAHNGCKVNALMWSSTWEMIWSAGDDGCVHAWHWSAKKKKVKRLYTAKGHVGVVTTLCSIGSTYAVAGCETGEIVIWTLNDKECSVLLTSSHLRSPIYSLCVRESATENLIFAGTLGRIHVFSGDKDFHEQSLPFIKIIQQNNANATGAMLPFTALCVVEGELWAASAGLISCYALEEKCELVRTISMEASSISSMTCVSFSDYLLIFVGHHSKLIVLDSFTKAISSTLNMPEGHILSLVQMSHDIVLSGDSLGNVLKWPLA